MFADMAIKAEILSQLGDQVYRNEESVQVALTEVYGDILDFCRQASSLLFKRGEAKTGSNVLRRSLWEPYEAKLGAINKSFEQHVDKLKLQMEFCKRKRDEHSHAMQFQAMLMQHQTHRRMTGLYNLNASMLDLQGLRQIEEERRRKERESERRCKCVPLCRGLLTLIYLRQEEKGHPSMDSLDLVS